MLAANVAWHGTGILPRGSPRHVATAGRRKQGFVGDPLLTDEFNESQTDSPQQGQAQTRQQMDAASRRGASADTGYKARESASSPAPTTPCWCGSGKKYKRCHMSEDKAKAAG